MNKEEFYKSITSKFVVPQTKTDIVYAAYQIKKPVIITGNPGTGKTSFSKLVGLALSSGFERLQCFNGISYEHTIGEWNYQKQLLEIQARSSKNIFTNEFFIPRPLLRAVNIGKTILIDEVNRGDEEFQNLLLETIDERQVSIPEMGTVKANDGFFVVMTANINDPGTVELSSALLRRCIRIHFEYPDFETEKQIVTMNVPDAKNMLVNQIVELVRNIRKNNKLRYPPSPSDSITWTKLIIELFGKDVEKATDNQLEKTYQAISKTENDDKSFENAALNKTN